MVLYSIKLLGFKKYSCWNLLRTKEIQHLFFLFISCVHSHIYTGPICFFLNMKISLSLNALTAMCSVYYDVNWLAASHSLIIKGSFPYIRHLFLHLTDHNTPTAKSDLISSHVQAFCHDCIFSCPKQEST